MALPEPAVHDLELHLRPSPAAEGEPSPLYDVFLFEPERSRLEAGVARLGFSADSASADERSAERFRQDFAAGRGVKVAEALGFGRLLLARLLAEEPVRRLWQESADRREARGLPLRLAVVLPPGRAAAVADLPLELLADEGGFLFRRFGWSLVRHISGFAKRPARWNGRGRMGRAWANPPLGDPPQAMPETIFLSAEARMGELGEALGMEVPPP
jgi:hypothetical protein